jgi:hypothetical protein
MSDLVMAEKSPSRVENISGHQTHHCDSQWIQVVVSKGFVKPFHVSIGGVADE